jgi:hypothetical protein
VACRYDSGRAGSRWHAEGCRIFCHQDARLRGFRRRKAFDSSVSRSRTFDRKPPARRLNSLSVKCNRRPRRNAPGSRNVCRPLALWELSAPSPLARHECASRAERTGFASDRPSGCRYDLDDRRVQFLTAASARSYSSSPGRLDDARNKGRAAAARTKSASVRRLAAQAVPGEPIAPQFNWRRGVCRMLLGKAA